MNEIANADDYFTAVNLYRRGTRFMQTLDLKAVELKFGLDEKFEPTDFEADNCFYRGIIDVVAKTQRGYSVHDWKTGWSKPDPRQIISYALAVKRHKVNVDYASFYLLRTGAEYDYDISMEEMNSVKKFIKDVWKDIKERGEDIENYPQSFYGCEWCGFRNICKPKKNELMSEKVQKAELERAEAKDVFSKAREVVKNTGKPIEINADTIFAPTVTEKYEMSRKEKDAKEHKLKQWLAKNHPEEVRYTLTEPIVEELPEDLKSAVRKKESVSIKIISKEEWNNGKINREGKNG